MEKCSGKKYENVLGNEFICVTEEEIVTISQDANIKNVWRKETPMYFAIKKELEQIDQQNKTDDVFENLQEVVIYITKFKDLVKIVGFFEALKTILFKSKKEELEKQGINWCFWCRY